MSLKTTHTLWAGNKWQNNVWLFCHNISFSMQHAQRDSLRISVETLCYSVSEPVTNAVRLFWASFPRRTKKKVWLRINHYRYWQIINLSKLKKCAKTFTINHLERQCWRSGPSLAACPAGDCGAAAPCPAWGWRGGRRWGSGGACCCCCYPGCCWTCCPASCRPCPPGRCCQLSFQPAGPSCAGDKLKIIHGQCSGAVLFWLCSGSSSIFEQFFAVNLFRNFYFFLFPELVL